MQLMRENVAGTVILYAVIHADGTVGDVRVLRGVDDRLDRFASEASRNGSSSLRRKWRRRSMSKQHFRSRSSRPRGSNF